MDYQKIVGIAYDIAEKPIEGAPVIFEDDGHGCIPQHFLEYNHSYESVSQVVNDIEFSDKYPIFVSQEDDSLILQVGVIGFDNYKKKKSKDQKHIVYGRKWRVEKNLPSAEIIQTAFLALKIAREHEIRELLSLKSEDTGKKSTPFSGHHDTPYLAEKLTNVEAAEGNKEGISERLILSYLSRLEFDGQSIELVDFQKLSGAQAFVEIKVKPEEDAFSDVPEMENAKVSFLIKSANENVFFTNVANALIDHSNGYVAENFKYRGFKRFSPNVAISEIGDISISLRNKQKLIEKQSFFDLFKQTNFKVDSTRVPVLQQSMVHKINKLQKEHGTINGHLPIHHQ